MKRIPFSDVHELFKKNGYEWTDTWDEDEIEYRIFTHMQNQQELPFLVLIEDDGTVDPYYVEVFKDYQEE